MSHWVHFSRLKAGLSPHVERLVKELAGRLPSGLDYSYASLDAVSAYVEAIGVDTAMVDLYDHLVAYVGEIIRRRTQGEWKLRHDGADVYPYIRAPRHAIIMPINVVWGEFCSIEPVAFRTAAANEVRSARARFM
ncbi:MAG: hypothetical protein R3B13_21400 [Polyangiaceae bacterium]